MTRESGGSLHGSVRAWCLLLFGAPLYLYLNTFAFPHIPFHLDGDQTYFWTYALRMLHGEHIYRDFFQFTPPGADLFFLAWFKLFGPRLWVMNAALILLGTALCAACFSIAARLMLPAQALLAAAFVLVLTYGRLLDATHHWFSLLALLCAVRIVMQGWTGPRAAAAGALLGIASFFTQTASVAGAIALVLALVWEGAASRTAWRRVLLYQAILLSAFGLMLGLLSAYFLAKIGWRQLWYFLVTYPEHFVEYGRHHFFPGLDAPLTLRNLPDLARRIFIFLLPLCLYPAVLVYCWRKRDARVYWSALPLCLSGLFLWLEVTTRANWIRLYIASIPALILLFLIIIRSLRWRALSAAGWTIVACLAFVQTWSRHHDGRRLIELPAGRTVLSPQKYEKFSWLAQHTRPGDLFYQALWVNVYPPLQLRSPAYLDVLFTNEETRPEFVDVNVQQLERTKVKYILWSPVLNEQRDSRGPWENHLGPLRTYLHSHYRRVQVFADGDEVWERE